MVEQSAKNKTLDLMYTNNTLYSDHNLGEVQSSMNIKPVWLNTCNHGYEFSKSNFNSKRNTWGELNNDQSAVQ